MFIHFIPFFFISIICEIKTIRLAREVFVGGSAEIFVLNVLEHANKVNTLLPLAFFSIVYEIKTKWLTRGLFIESTAKLFVLQI